MKRIFALLGLTGVLPIAAQQSPTFQVQLHYTGSGTVDATHKMFVRLWDSPYSSEVFDLKPTSE